MEQAFPYITGQWAVKDGSGKLIGEGLLVLGKPQGRWVFYHENGKKSAEGTFDGGVPSKDCWTWFDTDGAPTTDASTYGGAQSGEIAHAKDLTVDIFKDIESLYEKRGKDFGKRVSTGLLDLDTLLCGGFTAGELIVLGGRPGMGKTPLALSVAMHAALGSKNTLYVSMEVDKQSVAMKALTVQSNLSLTKLLQGVLNNCDWPKLAQAAGRLVEAPLSFASPVRPTIESLCTLLREANDALNSNLHFVTIDYLQLIEGCPRNEHRERDLAAAVRGLKHLARELDIPILLVSQLNRSLESRFDKHPVLSDLRDSGAIEDHADRVLFLYRDTYYNPASDDMDVAEICLAKNRSGRTDTVLVSYHPESGHFCDYGKARTKLTA